MKKVLIGVASLCVLCMSGYAGSITHVASHATPGLVDEINANLDVRVTMDSDKTSGTSEYQWDYDPDCTAAGDTALRTDGLHVGTETDSASATNPYCATYFTMERSGPAATAAWPGGSPDHGLRVVAVNRATNNAAYGLRGAHVKAKNYSSGTLGSLEGLFLECIGDGTENNGEGIVLKLGTDSSTVDYGIDMDLVTADVADIRMQNGTTMLNSDANTLTITEAIVDVVGQPRDDGRALICAPSTTTLQVQHGTGTNTQVITFNPTFNGAPTVLVSMGETATLVPWAASVTGTNCTLGGDAAGDGSKLIRYIAIGNRP